MITLQTFKNNISEVSTVVGFAITIIGGAAAIEARYAKADDIKQMREFQSRSHDTLKYEQRQSVDILRKQNIEDKLFELRLKPNPTQVDRAMIQRYEDQLKEVTGRLNQPAPPPPPR